MDPQSGTSITSSETNKSASYNARHLILIITVALIPYLTLIIIGADFVNYDDDWMVLENQKVRSLDTANIKEMFNPYAQEYPVYLPIRELSYALDFRLWGGLNPAGFHLTNILLHVLNCILLYILIKLMFKREKMALITALIFAAHPAHVESVAWIAARKDVLSGLFFLAAFISYLKFRENIRAKRFIFYAMLVIFFWLSMLSKMVTVTLPLLIILYEICTAFKTVSENPDTVKPDSPRKKIFVVLAYTLPLFIFAGIAVFLASIAAREGAAIKWYNVEPQGLQNYFQKLLWHRLPTASVAAMHYFGLWLWPFGLSVRHLTPPVLGFSWSALSGVVVTLAALAGTAWSWKKSKYIFFGAAWFFIAYAPTSNIIPMSTVVAERYLYLPSIGFCLIFAVILNHSAERLQKGGAKKIWKHSIMVLISALIIVYSALTAIRCLDWKDSGTLWQSALKQDPDHAFAHINLAKFYHDSAAILLLNNADAREIGILIEKSKKHSEKAVELSREENDLNLGRLAYLWLGRIYSATGEREKAVIAYNNSNKLVDMLAETALRQRGERERNILLAESARTYNLLGIELFKLKRLSAAKEAMLYALKISHPHKATLRLELLTNLGNIYSDLYEFGTAKNYYMEALNLRQDHRSAWRNMGILFERQGLYQKAARCYREVQALSAESDGADLLTRLGNKARLLEMAEGRFDKSKKLFEDYAELAESYHDLDLPVQLRATLEKAQSRFPNNSEIHLALASYWLTHPAPDVNKAVAHLDKARQLGREIPKVLLEQIEKIDSEKIKDLN